jgi:hypothetical protein
MRNRALVFAAVTAVAIVVFAISCSTPDDIVVESGQVAAAVDVFRSEDASRLPEPVKSIADKFVALEGDLTVAAAEELRPDARASLINALAKLDEKIAELAPQPNDSEELKSWKLQYRECLTNYRNAADTEAARTTGEAPASAGLISASSADPPCAREAANTNAIQDPEEKKKADKQAKESQIALGVALVAVGLLMLAFGVPGADVVIALGVAMVAAAFSGGGGGGTERNSGSDGPGTQTQSGGDRALPAQYNGFTSYGGNGGSYSFLYSAPQNRWMLVDFSSGQPRELARGNAENTQNLVAEVENGSLSDCALTFDYGPQDNTTQPPTYVTMVGSGSCPNFELQRSGESWTAVNATAARTRIVQ